MLNHTCDLFCLLTPKHSVLIICRWHTQNTTWIWILNFTECQRQDDKISSLPRMSRWGDQLEIWTQFSKVSQFCECLLPHRFFSCHTDSSVTTQILLSPHRFSCHHIDSFITTQILLTPHRFFRVSPVSCTNGNRKTSMHKSNLLWNGSGYQIIRSQSFAGMEGLILVRRQTLETQSFDLLWLHYKHNRGATTKRAQPLWLLPTPSLVSHQCQGCDNHTHACLTLCHLHHKSNIQLCSYKY